MQLKGKGMQLKVKDMHLKVSIQKNIGERGSRRDICSLYSSLGFFFTRFYSLLLGLIKGKILSSNNLLYLYQKGKTPFLLRKILSCHTHI